MTILTVCLTVKIQFDNTSTSEYSSYSPSARLLCLIARLGPLFRNSGSAPVYRSNSDLAIHLVKHSL